ncbi:McbB family protein [Aerococcus urinaeequi]|uniref:McbB family protein n=1 Tax=Aerococcus urinaeequi TaxID=51665 RepID=UPI003D6C19C9
MYKLLNFVIFKKDKSLIIQSNMGIFTVEDYNMMSFIEEIDTNTQSKYIQESFLEKFFSNKEKEQALDFLFKVGCLSPIHEFNFQVKRIIFFTNNKKMINLVSFLDDVESENLFVTDKLPKDINNSDLIVAFFNPTSWDEINELYKKVYNSDSIMLLSYIYDNNLIVDNMYKKDWHVPCPKCIKAQLENRYRLNFLSEMTYQNVIDQLYYENNEFQIERKISMFECTMIFSFLWYLVEGYITNNQGKKISPDLYSKNFLDIYQFNLNSKRIEKETATFWELCECYE